MPNPLPHNPTGALAFRRGVQAWAAETGFEY